MPIHIRVVQRAEHLTAVRQVIRELGPDRVSENGRTEDSREDPVHILLSDGNQPIGALTICRRGPGGSPSPGSSPFDRLMRVVPTGGRAIVVERFLLLPRYRGREGLFHATVKVVLQLAASWGCDHLMVRVPAGFVQVAEHLGLGRLAPHLEKKQADEQAMYAPISALRPGLLTDLNGPMVRALGPFFHRAIYIQGDVVFRQGDSGRAAYVVARGSVCVTVRRPEAGENGEEAVLDILGPGELFGELALLDGAPRMATVRVYATETDLAVIDGAQFQAAIDRDPSRVRAILQLLARRLRSSSLRAVSYLPAEVAPALVQVIVDVARTSGIRTSGLVRGVTPEWLAGQVGSLPDAVMEMTEVLERRGLISWVLEGLWVHDVEGLAHLFPVPLAREETSGYHCHPNE